MGNKAITLKESKVNNKEKNKKIKHLKICFALARNFPTKQIGSM